jgi:cellulose synthase/poly-beta-1,6-N-acetylglucosamine synthase-like glycosyltransferase
VALGEEVADRPERSEAAHTVRAPAAHGCVDHELCANRVLSRPQAELCVLVLAVMAVLLVLVTWTTVLVLVVSWSAVCAAIAAQQLLISIVGLLTPTTTDIADALPESELPRYTVLVPLYREATVARSLVSALDRLDYPRELLDVKLLVEADDPETWAALERTDLGPQFEVLEVPRGGPRTKPKACNFGLSRARGELVVIFDAEDRPEPDQLKKAAAAFRGASSDVACFQARLGFWNRTTNLLTRYSTAEFCAMFDVARPGLERLGAPIPLGGTSNHFPVALLRELGAWDEFNVTEDADLGVRLARAGYRTRLLESTTYEEANSRLGNWIRQQSRWIKGYLQTWLVHVRDPRRLQRELGLRAAAHFHMTMLAPVVPILLAPVGWATTLLWMLSTAGVLDTSLPPWLLTMSACSFIAATTAGIWVWALALRRRGYHEIAPFCAAFPLLTLVKSAAAIKGLAQLVTRPSYWEKTVHGLDTPLQVSSLVPPPAPSGD